MNYVIKLNGVCFTTNNLYNQVNNVSFSLNESEKLFIDANAENGCEELFRLLLGLEKPKEGEILINGNLVNKIDYKSLNLLYIPKTLDLFKNKTVSENIKYFIKLRIKNKKEVDKILNESITKFNLSDIQNKKANQLSVYEKLLVILARSFYREKQIIFIENVFDNLTLKELDNIMELLNSYYFTNKTTVILWGNEKVYKKLTGFSYKRMEFGSLK